MVFKYCLYWTDIYEWLQILLMDNWNQLIIPPISRNQLLDFAYFVLILKIFLFQSNYSYAQQNLIPNPSLEDTISCPLILSQIHLCEHWSSYRNSSDYFNSCNNNLVGVPSNSNGFQYAYHGNAYAFVVTFSNQVPFDYREFIGIQLNSPMYVNLKYYISFYYSRAYSVQGGITGASNNLGIRFTNQSYVAGVNPMPIDNFSHGKIDSISYDTTQWSRAFFVFQPDSIFEYFVIGNFYDNAHTDTSGFNNNSAGYYIDAVCISTDSLYSMNWTFIEEAKRDEFSLNANITNNTIVINVATKVNYNIYSASGQILLSGVLNQEASTIDVSAFANGIYLLKIGSYCKKFIVY